MAQYNDHNYSHGLKLNTNLDQQPFSSSDDHVGDNDLPRPHRPSYSAHNQSQDTIRACATPPIEIPGQHEDSVAITSASSDDREESFTERFLRERKPSVTFDNEVTTDSGHRHSILEPPKKSASNAARGRSLAQALYEQQRLTRAHSESDRSQYDPRTGRHLPQFSHSPPSEEAHVGEARFPLLQDTVDALARRNIDMYQSMSLTSEATMSPVEDVILTPPDVNNHLATAPVDIVPSLHRQFSTSYDSPRPKSGRKASERWRDGEAAPDFFSRAGSLKNGNSRRPSRRDTLSSTKSPRSAASSFLRGISMSSSNDGAHHPAVDAEGATVGEDYVLGKQIGYGGFSIIREVKQISAHIGKPRTLAVKIVKKQIDGKNKEENDTAQAEFEHEVDLWRLLNHKNILALEAVYELKEATFCFIPLNTGGTLFDAVNHNRKGLPDHFAKSYAYQLASALRYLHLDARVVHRDIKLENCLVDTTKTQSANEPGHLRVCDFGLAQWISSDTDSNASDSMSSADDIPLHRYFGPADTSTSAFAGGSLEYAAPEILRVATNTSGVVQAHDLPPDKTLIHPAVDIWAFGVCLFALLMGSRPFADSFQPRVLMAILAGDWDKAGLKQRSGEVAYRLVKMCLRMNMEKRITISEVLANEWFDDIREKEEGSDAESESGRAGGWRL